MRHLPPLSGVVITLNEADRIERCVRSMAAVCREVIVVDSGSTDATVALATAAGARVVHQAWLGFAAQKNLAISLAAQPWVLLLDADEWLEPEAQARLLALFETSAPASADVFILLRRVHFLGHRMRAGSFAREPVERLFRAHLRHELLPVHERLDTAGARVAPSTIALEHDTARDAAEYWAKLERYARLWADAQRARGRRAGPGRGALAALAYLGKNLLLRGGIIDGAGGWAFHRLHARYARLKYDLLRESPRP